MEGTKLNQVREKNKKDKADNMYIALCSSRGEKNFHPFLWNIFFLLDTGFFLSLSLSLSVTNHSYDSSEDKTILKNRIMSVGRFLFSPVRWQWETREQHELILQMGHSSQHIKITLVEK
jgi:hypothetical protein